LRRAAVFIELIPTSRLIANGVETRRRLDRQAVDFILFRVAHPKLAALMEKFSARSSAGTE
jgi:hypothetical protein